MKPEIARKRTGAVLLLAGVFCLAAFPGEAVAGVAEPVVLGAPTSWRLAAAGPVGREDENGQVQVITGGHGGELARPPRQTGKLGEHPRVILNPRRIEKLRAIARTEDARFIRLRDRCEGRLKAKAGAYLSAGPAGSLWAGAAKEYALLFLLEDDPARRRTFAQEALVYMNALANDLESVGDGRGGLEAVKADEGYPVRIRGTALATAYDWLYDFDGFDPGTKARLYARLNEWIDWYTSLSDGTARKPGRVWDNRFAANFAVRLLAAVATYDENPKSKIRYFDEAVAQEASDITPAFAEDLKGGYPPEGWESRNGYDCIVDAFLTLENVTDRRYDRTFFAAVALAVINSTKPDRVHIYDGGFWQGKEPGYPLPLPLMARLSLMLGANDEGSFTRFYLLDFLDKETQAGLEDLDSLVYVDLFAPRTDFTKSKPRSYFSRGTGMVFMRASWEKEAFWCSLQSGSPHVSQYQNLDQGHITVNFLGEDLLVDAGMRHEELSNGSVLDNRTGEAGWHNTVFIDLPGKTTSFSQGTSKDGSTVDFEDVGRYVYVRANITGAYSEDPSGAKQIRARKVEREVFYLRPSALVIFDTVETRDPAWRKGLLFHFPSHAPPTADDRGVELVSGKARLGIYPMRPDGLSLEVFRQYGTRPGDREKGVYTWGARVLTEPGERVTRFLTTISAFEDGVEGGTAERPVIQPFEARGYLAILQCFEKFVAVGPSASPDKTMTLTLPIISPLDLYITGMKRSGFYSVTMKMDYVFSIVRITPVAKGSPTSPAGILGINLTVNDPPSRRR